MSPSRAPSEARIDATDEAIIALLETDGRATHRRIAEVVDLSRPATAARIHRLIDTGRVDVRGVVHPRVLGRETMAHVSLVTRGQASTVAEAVSALPETTLVSLTTGAHAVVAELRVGSVAGVDDALARIRAHEGVVSTETLLYTEVLRDVAAPVGPVTHNPGDLDRIDLALLGALQEDGRASYVELGRVAGLSAAAARRRVVRLVEGNVVRIGALLRHSGGDRRSTTGLGLRLRDPRSDLPLIADALPSVTFAARTLGQYDAVLTLSPSHPADLVEGLDRLRTFPGVTSATTWTHLRFVKETYAALDLDPTTR